MRNLSHNLRFLTRKLSNVNVRNVKHTPKCQASLSYKSGADMSKLLKLAQTFNCFYLSGFKSNECRPFIVDGFQVGLIRPEVINQLHQFPEVFRITNDFVELNPAFRDYEERSVKLNDILQKFRKENTFIALKGWRDECYEVSAEFTGENLLRIERAAACLFGIKQYGVHINGYVKHPSRGLCIWLQQRSSTKQTWPNKWDNIVAGGLSVGYGILETAYKEAAEEASIPKNILNNMSSAGAVSFFFESERGLFPNTEFVYDLELPLNFTPRNADGEVQRFELLTPSECIDRMLGSEFKTTSAPVVLDFLIRHGIVTSENEPNLLRIVELLHVPLQTLYSGQVLKQNGHIATNNT